MTANHAEKILEVRGLTKTYGGEAKKGAKQPTPTLDVLKGIDIDIYRGDVVCLIGPSGCGKSTFLKTLNRMNDLVPGVRIEGDVRLKGEDIFAREMELTDLRRRVGMVFQKANPFPMSIYDNITYGPKLHGVRNKAELDELVEKYGCLSLRRGKGLMQGLVITKPIKEINDRAIEEGLLIIQAQGNVIRFVPPLIVEKEHIDQMVEKMRRILA